MHDLFGRDRRRFEQREALAPRERVAARVREAECEPNQRGRFGESAALGVRVLDRGARLPLLGARSGSVERVEAEAHRVALERRLDRGVEVVAALRHALGVHQFRVGLVLQPVDDLVRERELGLEISLRRRCGRADARPQVVDDQQLAPRGHVDADDLGRVDRERFVHDVSARGPEAERDECALVVRELFGCLPLAERHAQRRDELRGIDDAQRDRAVGF